MAKKNEFLARFPNANPWRRLPANPPFVLPEEKAEVEAFNDKTRRAGHDHVLNLDLIPVPFVGAPDAPVIFLGNIAGAGDENYRDYERNPSYASRLRKNLLHENEEFPFLMMDPRPETLRSHKEWWSVRLKHLLDSFGNGVKAESILARAIMTIEYFPYRSLSDDYRHDSLSLPSQDYCRLLVMNAMKNEAVIVVRYGRSRWFDAVRGLKNYSHLLLLKESRKVHISPKGFVDTNGYQRVVDKIQAWLPQAV